MVHYCRKNLITKDGKQINACQKVPSLGYHYHHHHHHHHHRAHTRTHAEAAHRASLTRQTNSQEHWLHGGHKKACKAYVLAATVHAQQERDCKAAVATDRCLVCLGPPREPTRLPCGHSFCTGCVEELRGKGVAEACPLCRAPLPPGPEKLYELGVQVRAKLTRAVDPSCTHSWPPLSASQQEEMDGAIVMFQEAMDQVSGRVRGSMVPC